MQENSITEIQKILRKFAQERDWEQFHSPKNLVMALSGEVGELAEHFQWLTESESYDKVSREEVAEELADCFLYLLRIADRLDIDLIKSAHDKIALNEKKYPKEQVRGSAKKYNEYNKD